MLELLTSPEAWAAFVTLSVMEIVLGIDNIIFISILVGKLPEPQATRARQIGLLLALRLPRRAALRHHLDHRPDRRRSSRCPSSFRGWAGTACSIRRSPGATSS